MTPAEAMTAIFNGTLTALAIIGAMVMADTVLLALGARRSLTQSISHAWHWRPHRAHPRTRRTRPQGPGN